MLYRYLFVAIACITLLIGIQVPNFLSQYHQRLHAQLTEVTENLSGFQQIADRHFNGDLAALINHHKTSNDTVFREEAMPLQAMYNRWQRFAAEQRALQVSYPAQLLHLVVAADKEIRTATWQQYSYAVPLTTRALVTGGVFTLIVLLVLDILKGLLRRLFGRSKKLAH
ncbi:MAG: DUF2937 family protein [Idiomarina sp.]